jgi:hypothetical protein
MTDDITTAAVTGPWEAVIADGHGWVTTLAEALRDDLDANDLRIAIVRGSAAPYELDGDRKLPGGYDSGDMLVEWGDFVGLVELRTRLAQAEAMVVGLNAAGAR